MGVFDNMVLSEISCLKGQVVAAAALYSIRT